MCNGIPKLVVHGLRTLPSEASLHALSGSYTHLVMEVCPRAAALFAVDWNCQQRSASLQCRFKKLVGVLVNNSRCCPIIRVMDCLLVDQHFEALLDQQAWCAKTT